MAAEISDRENRVTRIWRNVVPTQAKGLRLTDPEREALLTRVDTLRLELVNCSTYDGTRLEDLAPCRG